MYFNTSHVNVNPSITVSVIALIIYFNTSHVNVNQTLSSLTSMLYIDFNTSHVNVNRFPITAAYKKAEFQYISC